MTAKTVQVRTRRRRTRRNAPRRWFVIAFLMLFLVIIGVYYATSYVEDQQFANYPLEYKELIRQTAADYGLKPAHVAAVVMCESSFRKDAVSKVGALGLMQIMPETGAWIAGKFDDLPEFTPDDLLAPELNLRMGCWYLSWLLNRYDGDMRCATAAYHAGQGMVDQWLDNPEYSADGQTLASIPYNETSKYTERVLKAYEKYSELYDFET